MAKEQLPINLSGEHVADPESSSYMYEPECTFFKPTTDVVVIGDAICPNGPATHLLVDIQVGQLKKRLGVIGDRQWIKQAVGYHMTEPTPFERMPLTYENAFGGWDKRDPVESKQEFEPRNTVGKGLYQTHHGELDEPMWLPNIENPDQLIQRISDRPAPVGCGFTLPHWQPRARFAGTFDKAWEETRSPMLPLDFDRRYFNAASDGLISPQYLAGNEAVRITHMTPERILQFNLPGARPPVALVELRAEERYLSTHLDTVIINTRSMQLQLIWRNYCLLDNGPHDVKKIELNYG